MPAGSRFAVAVHTLTVLGYLQKHGVPRVSSRQVAMSVSTNAVVIRNLISDLKKAGLVSSKEGKEGGVSLAKPPGIISLRDVYAAVEEPCVLALNKNPEMKACPVSRGIKKVLPALVDEVDEVVAKALQKKTLAEIIEQMPKPTGGSR